jgi:hypothetical protein
MATTRPTGRSSSRKQLLARLHCIKKEQGWSDDEYRDILEARTGKRSAADLDGPALARVVAALGGQKSALAPRPAHEWSWVDTAPASKQPMLKKLIMLAGGLGVAKGRQVAYLEGIAKQMSGANGSAGPVEKPLPMCDEGELHRIIQAVAVHLKRKGLNPDAIEPPAHAELRA